MDEYIPENNLVVLFLLMVTQLSLEQVNIVIMGFYIVVLHTFLHVKKQHGTYNKNYLIQMVWIMIDLGILFLYLETQH